MSRELKFLNYFCVLVAVGFLVVAVLTLVTAGDLLTTDALFFSTVCLLMAVIFAAGPILYLWTEGKLPVPFIGRNVVAQPQVAGSTTAAKNLSAATVNRPPQLLDAKGRAVPADVRSMVSQMNKAEPKDA